jgi:hypothetical protein
MDRLLKTIFAVSICVSVFAACNKNAGGAKVNAPRGGKNGEKTAPGADKNKPGATPVQKEEDRSKQTAQQKAESDRLANDIKELRPLLRDANQLIKEIWPILIKPDGESSSRGNALGLMSWVLESNFSVKGYKLAKEEKDKASCPKGESELKKLSEYEFDVIYANCENKNDKKTIARITRLKDGGVDKWKIEFKIGAMDAKPELMMGSLMKLWNSELDATCTMQKLKHGRLGLLICENIGQDISSAKYMILKELKFEHPSNDVSRTVEEPLQVKYTIYKVTDGNTPVEDKSGTAVDQIRNGEIKISEFQAKLLSEVPAEIEDTAKAKLAADLKEKQEKAEKEKAEKEKKDKQTGVAADVPAGVVQQGDNRETENQRQETRPPEQRQQQDQQQQQNQDQQQQPPPESVT